MIIPGNYYIGRCSIFRVFRYGKALVSCPTIHYYLGPDDYSFAECELSPMTALDIYILFGDV